MTIPVQEPEEKQIVEETVQVQMEKEADSGEKEENQEANIEESLTPPLLPNMKVKNQSQVQNEKKVEKDNKVKKSQWDMFAEQDIFKADTNVRFFLIFFTVLLYLKRRYISYNGYYNWNYN